MKAFLITLGIVIVLYLSYRIFRIASLDDNLKQLYQSGAVILDVRTVAEFNRGHIEGSLNIPLSQLHGDSIPLDKLKVYITVCSHGLRSVRAEGLLKQKDFRVYNGGAWTDLKKTLEK